jgi:hypothetical protein
VAVAGRGRPGPAPPATAAPVLTTALAVALLAAGSAALADPPPRKQATAVRISPGAVRLDGRLDEAVWRDTTPLTDFVQKEPVEGAPPTDAMQVWIVYDDEALYVAGRMGTQGRGAIQSPISRRDNVSQSEHLYIALDTFLDRRTAYTFGVTASGVRLDFYHPNDDELDVDSTFDPVWEARAFVEDHAWTCEMRIPFSQLRFNDRAEQVWGMNLDHWIPSRFEDVFWVPVPKNVRAWSSRFGELRGISGIRPSRRVEIVPYAAADAVATGAAAPGNPFVDGARASARVGADAKMGLGPNLTLQATFNPDFGQVEADPAEVNLTAFETVFDEKRPFFTEGRQLFTGSAGPSYFYSRRIGGRPRGLAEGEFVDYPEAATILGAAKLTGRLASGLSIGALAAVTDREDARTFTSGRGLADVRVDPLTSYGVVRAQQQFGAAASTFGGILTAVHRNFDADDPLSAVLTRDAFSGGADSTLRLKGGAYEVAGYLGFSHVAGEPDAILRLQRSSARYFQRPDADYVEEDPGRRSLSGYAGSLEARKVSGRHWLWTARASAESPGFEVNDAGEVQSADDLKLLGQLKYRETTPGRRLHGYSVSLDIDNQWNYGRDRRIGIIRSDATLTFKNFWQANLSAWMEAPALDARLTRGGPSMGTPRGWVTIAELNSGFQARNRWNGRVYYGENELGGQTYRLSGSVSFRPRPGWQVTVDPNYLRDKYPQQYVATLEGGRPETFGRRYVFGFIDRSTLLAQIRLSYVFKPDLTLDLYAEPFAASGRYLRFGELAAPRRRELRVYGTDGTTVSANPDGSRTITDGGRSFTLDNADFNVRSFRSNLVLRWEWRPGSLLFVVWQQDRSNEIAQGALVGPGDLFDSFRAPGDNVFAVKASFWLPIR